MNMVAGSLPAKSEARKCDIVPVVPGISWHLLRGAYIQFHVRLSFEISMKNDRGARSKYGAKSLQDLSLISALLCFCL